MQNLFLIFLRLGLTSFGGPIAHIGYFREEFVTRRKWFSEQSYSEIVALCQFLPGPASSQVGLIIGLSRAGLGGAFVAWLGFTLPSAIAITVFAMTSEFLHGDVYSGVLQGLKIVAVAVIAQAIFGMARTLCADIQRATIMLAVAGLMLLFANPLTQMAAVVMAACFGMILIRVPLTGSAEKLPIKLSTKFAVISLVIFFLLLILLPLLAYYLPNASTTSFSAFYRTGSMVFGGGHVVLPLLQTEVVATGWVDSETFLAGYGAAQAVPGPLFTFASFLGASIHSSSLGWYGGFLCLLAIFLPAFLLVFGVVPFWEKIRGNILAQRAIAGANAGVVGLLVAVLWDPVWISTVKSSQDLGLVILALIALIGLRLPSWVVVIACALGAVLIELV